MLRPSRPMMRPLRSSEGSGHHRDRPLDDVLAGVALGRRRHQPARAVGRVCPRLLLDAPDLGGRVLARLGQHLLLEPLARLHRREPRHPLEPGPRLLGPRRRRPLGRLRRLLARRQPPLLLRELYPPPLDLSPAPIRRRRPRHQLRRLPVQLLPLHPQLPIDLRPQPPRHLLGLHRRLPRDHLRLDARRRQQPLPLLIDLRQRHPPHRAGDEERHQRRQEHPAADDDQDLLPRQAHAYLPSQRTTPASVTMQSSVTSPSPAGQRSISWKP